MAAVAVDTKKLHASARYRIECFQYAARRLLLPPAIHGNVAPDLHAVDGRRDDAVRRLDDVAGRAVVLGQEGRTGRVVGLEAPDELDRGALEGIDVLVVVADREQAEAQVGIVQRAAGDGSAFAFADGESSLIFIRYLLLFNCQEDRL